MISADFSAGPEGADLDTVRHFVLQSRHLGVGVRRDIPVGIFAVHVEDQCGGLAGMDDPGKDHFIERVESRNGIYTIECAAELGYGSREYELIEI